jgi:transcriptional regulator with XRE-family HTH domain
MSDVPHYRVRADIRRIVARRNQSQNRFAQRCNLTSGHLSQLLSGKRLAGPDVRRRLLEALHPMIFDEIFEELEARPPRSRETRPFRGGDSVDPSNASGTEAGGA